MAKKKEKIKCTVDCLQRFLKSIMAVILMVLVVGSILTFPQILERLAENEFFPEYLSEYTTNNEDCPGTPPAYKKNPINEIEVSLAFLASIATIAIAIGAYTQLRSLKESSKNTSKTLRMDFVHHLDQQWCSQQITEIRCELWKLYRQKQESEPKKDSIKAVGKIIFRADKDNERNPNDVNTKELFKHLNFLELMGSIYLYKEQKIIDDDMLQSLFAGRLHTYLKFYETYLTQHYRKKETAQKPYALKLLDYLDELEKKRKVMRST